MAATGLWDDPETLWDDPSVLWDSTLISSADLKHSASLAGRVLASGQVSGTSASTVYTVPAASLVKLVTAVLCNVSGSAVTVSVSIVPAGGTAGSSNRIVSGYSLAAGESIVLNEVAGGLLDAGAFVSVQCSAGSSVNYLLTGLLAS